MAEHTWSFDAPSGVYKNHTMSEQLRYAAIAETKGMQFVSPEPGYGKKKGESITITRIAQLAIPTNNGVLSENTEIPQDVMTITTVAITVSEWGRSVPYTSLSDDLSEFNIENIVQRVLKDQMKVSMDNAAFAAFKQGQIKAEMTGIATVSFDTGGAATSQASVNLNMYGVEVIRDYMHTTLRIPAYEGDDYMCLISTKGKRGIISDPAWETWHKYTDPESKYNSEIGRIENIRFVEVNNLGALGAIGASGICGEAVFFGADAVAMAVALDPELRAKIPTDYGRSRGVAWYGILQFGVVWNTANAGEARIIHLSST